MVDGFWTAVFKGGAGQEHGVVVFTKGKIFGGDSVHTYIGNYEGEPNIKGKIAVHQFASGPNVMGVRGDYEIEFKSEKVQDKNIEAQGQQVGNPGNRLLIRLTRQADLP